MSESSEMEAVLAELRSGGVHDSTGKFSIDLRHGLEKLRRYQLLDKNRYGLLLMAAAYRRQASEVNVKNDADDLILSWPGTPLTRAELEDLFRLDGPLLPLGLALLSAQALNPRFIHVDTGPLRLELKAGAMRILDIKPVDGVRIHVRERYSFRALAKYAFEWLALPPESSLIARHCSGLGRKITVNGKPLETRLDIGPCWLVLKLRGKQGAEPLDAVLIPPGARVEERELEGDFSALAIMGPNLQRRGLTVVAQGLRFPQPDAMSPDMFLALLLVRPDQRIDLSYARIGADAALSEALTSVNRAIDQVLGQNLDAAPPAMLPMLATRLARRGQTDLWLAVQARILRESNDPRLLRELVRVLPERAQARVWQEALEDKLGQLERLRRQNIHSLAELRSLVNNLSLLANLRAEPALERAIHLELGFLHAALGDLAQAEAFLRNSPNHRLGLVTLLRARDPRFLPSTPLANGLTALLQDRMGEASEHLAEAPPSLVVLDLRARLAALAGDWKNAIKLNQLALDQSPPGLMLRQRQTFANALKSKRLDHAIVPPADLTEQLEADRQQRGIALWSRGDAPVMAHLHQMLNGVGDTDATRTATVQLGAVQPYTRVVAWTVAGRRLALKMRPEAFELALLVELTALWGPEGF